MCDFNKDVTTTYFKKEQVLCDSKSGKAYKCKDDLKCSEAGSNPTDSKVDKTKDAFKNVWEEVSSDKTKGKVFVTKSTQSDKESKKPVNGKN